MTFGAPPSRRKARSCSSAQIRVEDFQTMKPHRFPAVSRASSRRAASAGTCPSPGGAPSAPRRSPPGLPRPARVSMTGWASGDVDRLQPRHVPLHARVARREAVVVDQVLPDRHRVPARGDRPLDHLPVGLAGARLRRRPGRGRPGRGRWTPRWPDLAPRRGRWTGRWPDLPRPRGRWTPRWPDLTAAAGPSLAAGAPAPPRPSGTRSPSPGGPRSLPRCGAGASPASPAPPPAASSRRSRRWPSRRWAMPLPPSSTSRSLSSVGRFSDVPHWPVLGVPRGLSDPYASLDRVDPFADMADDERARLHASLQRAEEENRGRRLDPSRGSRSRAPCGAVKVQVSPTPGHRAPWLQGGGGPARSTADASAVRGAP